MIKFKDYLTELFDKPLPYIQTRKSEDLAKFQFRTSSGHDYIVTIENEDKNYQISFSTKLSNGRQTYSFNDELKGNASQVMSTVISICQLYFTKQADIGPDGDVESIYYIADDLSRIKLYNAIIKKFLNDHHIPYKFMMNSAMGQFKLFP